MCLYLTAFELFCRKGFNLGMQPWTSAQVYMFICKVLSGLSCASTVLGSNKHSM